MDGNCSWLPFKTKRGESIMMTAVQAERLEELRQVKMKTGSEEMEWEKLEALVEPVKKEVKRETK